MRFFFVIAPALIKYNKCALATVVILLAPGTAVGMLSAQADLHVHGILKKLKTVVIDVGGGG